MKLLFEIPLTPSDFKRSDFNWLSDRNNWLFMIEDARRFKTFNIEHEPAKEIQSASLMATKSCTSLSWNHDSTLLALVVDKRQIYLWELQSNQFKNFKPETRSSTYSTSKRARSGDIEVVAWSQVTNKLAIGYSTGKLLLCYFTDSNIAETLVDNSEGVLEKVVNIESSKRLDLFVCITVISEVLVMSYNGEVKFYIQIEHVSIKQVKFSDPSEGEEVSKDARELSHKSIWLACHLNDDRLLMKKILLTGNQSEQTKVKPGMDIFYNEKPLADDDDQSHMIDFHWLDSTYLIACFSSGVVMLLQIKSRIQTVGKQTLVSYFISSSETLNLTAKEYDLTNNDSRDNNLDTEFRSFELMSFEAHKKLDQSTFGSFSMIALTNYRLFYYELFKLEYSDTNYTFEKVDDLDLTENLKWKGLRLERVKWSLDCSMLAIQLTNAHILVYQTRLQNYLVTSNGPKTAYLSGTREITILDYGPTKLYQIDDSSLAEDDLSISANNNKALTVTLDLKPSVIAVGPKHLAIALNNCVWFYKIATSKASHLVNEAQLVDKQEYASVVLELKLSSRFVAVQFNNGRLKLHAIQSSSQANKEQVDRRLEGANVEKHVYYGDNEDNNDLDFLDDECFFPDPSRLNERISAFILTEKLFIYCTKNCYLNVFCLRSWALVQNCEHSIYFANNPIEKLYGNERGNKFVCLAKESRTSNCSNVSLYDLYSNQMTQFFTGCLYKKIFKSQLSSSLADHKQVMIKLDEMFPAEPKLNRVVEAIWDHDGRTVHLLSSRSIHIAVVLNHTLESEAEKLVLEYVATVCKPLSYRALYASNGIVSFQTSLGRVINSILQSHDDELKLTKLKSEIESLLALSADPDSIAIQSEVMQRKMKFFRQILSVHSLSKCKDIAEYLMSSDFVQQSTSDCRTAVDQILWKQIAARALFTMNLDFALMIYRKYGLLVFAQVLSEILADSRKKCLDSRCEVRTRLLVLLNCEVIDEEGHSKQN